MSLPDNTKPKEIVAGLNKLLKTCPLYLFAEHLPALNVSATDNVDIVAEKIKNWCETRPKIENNLKNEIYQMGAGGTDSDAPEEIVREFYETLKENQIRLGLSESSGGEDETDTDETTD